MELRRLPIKIRLNLTTLVFSPRQGSVLKLTREDTLWFVQLCFCPLDSEAFGVMREKALNNIGDE